MFVPTHRKPRWVGQPAEKNLSDGIHESLRRKVWEGRPVSSASISAWTFESPPSIAVAETMFLPTELARCGWLGVVYQMMDGFECAQIGEDDF